MKNKKKMDVGFITKYTAVIAIGVATVIIALGVILEAVFTFWLFLLHWLSYPIRKLWK